MHIAQIISAGLNHLLQSEDIKTRMKGIELAGALSRATEAEELRQLVIMGMNVVRTQLQDVTFTSEIEGIENILNFLPNAAAVRQDNCCRPNSAAYCTELCCLNRL